uniref:Cyclic nucleotide-binding domain-containing protein n=1 Tax=Fagus sylvatica TaxID=28930 RepID=A0A2N9EDH0_FAGSY
MQETLSSLTNISHLALFCPVTDNWNQFKDRSSEGTLRSGQKYYFEDGYPTNFRTTVERVLERLRGGFERGTKTIKGFKKPKSIPYVSDQPSKEYGPRKTILDPQGQFLQTWNKIFVLCCVISLALDPLFFYIPVIKIEGHDKCLYADKKLTTIACVLRTLFDTFYVLHIIFQFRTGYIAPSSRVVGMGDTINDPLAIAKRYLSTYFIIDILSILPFPQVVALSIMRVRKIQVPLNMKEMFVVVILTQYVPRLMRIYPLYVEVTRTSGILTQTAWAGAAYNLFLYLLASHVVGAFWYLFAIDREDTCWQSHRNNTGCEPRDFYCGEKRNKSCVSLFEKCLAKKPDDIDETKDFDYGIFTDALKSGMVESTDFDVKLFYCFWWGFRNLGYLQSTTMRVEEMRVKRTDAEQWMSHRMLPEELRARVRRYQQYKWQLTRGVEEENLLQTLPKDLRRDITRHLCLDLLKKVPMFEKMESQLFDALCDRLKPVLYTENSDIVLEGDPVDEMLFIMRGNLSTTTTNGGKTATRNTGDLKAGDFCGEELFAWALEPHSSNSLPISTRKMVAKTEVEAFTLRAADLKFVANQFRRLHSKQFYSQHWKIWAANRIQAVWRRHYDRKLYRSLYEAEERWQDAVTDEAGTSKVEHNDECKARVPKTLLLLPQKPAEPNLTAEDS